ncbi:unnamed protein product, partial [Polarella glacialis]
ESAVGQNGDEQAPSGNGNRLQHHCAGLLTAPREGPGLAITLGAQPSMDATHRVLGPLLLGRGALRRLEVLAPLFGEEAKPSQPVFLRLPPAQDEASASLSGARRHPFLTLELCPVDGMCAPFAEEAETEDAPLKPEELLDIADVEINCRDAEVAEMRQLPFSRDRQRGVQRVEEALLGVVERMEALPGDDGLAPDLAGQRMWLKERSHQLLRVMKKLH